MSDTRPWLRLLQKPLWSALGVLCLVLLLFIVVAIGHPSAAQSLLRSHNKHIENGNALMTGGKHKEALAEYDKAARELPSEAGVHFNRGLALRAQGDLDAALQAFKTAAQSKGDESLRAQAWLEAGITSYLKADALASKQQAAEAQKLFEQSAEASRESLRLKPGQMIAGWNLELALRRIQEQKQEQEKQQQENQQRDQKQEGQQPDKPEQDKPQDSDDEQPEKSQEQKPDQNEDQKQAQNPDQPQQQPQQKKDQHDQNNADSSNAPARALPRDAQRVLDALQQSEDNLERHKARVRAAREGRQVDKDW